ncbi:MAG TPA: AI-2E family transporter [Kofleriaceae bacterium]|nr:AI-2E family transporter [Kofleriaceae bacterium]
MSITAAVVIVALALWVTAEVFLLAFASVLIAIFLRAVAQPLVRLTHMPMRLVLALLLLAIIAIVALIGILMGPPLVAQFAQLQEKLPEAIDSLGKSGWGGAILQELPIIGHGRGANALSGSVLSQVGAALSTVADIVAHGVFLLFTALFFAFNPDIYVRGAMRLFPPASRNRVRNLAEALNEALRNWLIGQFVSMCIVGVMVGVGLWILGMPLALLLGFLAFAFEFIPIVGPILAAVPGVLVATTESITMALVVAGLYAVVQIIENNVLIPIIQQRMVYVPPAIVLIATFVAALLFGFVGVLVATPLLAAIFVVIKVLYVEDVLHEPIHLPHGFKS